MANYNFETLSPAEFETLCRDLLQKELGLTLDSFTSGRDDGVDLRYARDKNQVLIVQCKRHLTTYSQLKSHLRKEVQKVNVLKPKRYILATSLPLTPKRKEEIQRIFSPYIVAPDDIFGRDNLNNLIGKYPDVEKQHYKLWFSSVSILNKILHSDVLNKTRFEEEDIRKTVSVFAENDGFPRAMDIFRQRGFVIISGAPGVGKTTLARMLIFRLIASSKYDQFVFISRDINEAFALLDDETPQLFFFDDFLGRNFFGSNMERNEESDLTRFVEKVVNSKNKGLILTTREYVLQQAQSQYPDLKVKHFEHDKYTVDLGSYTKKVKARILYNHMHIAGLPSDYLGKFLDDGLYKTLINHKNYNPRLIESILREEPWRDDKPEDFSQTLISYFDDPQKIWKDVFEQGISDNARLVLKIMFTLETPVSFDNLYALFEKNLTYLSEKCDYHSFERALKELDGTFIKTYRNSDNTNILAEYQNPSIFDFLMSYYSRERRDDLAIIVRNAMFLDQIVQRFTATSDSLNFGRIHTTPSLRDIIATKILGGLDKLPWSQDNIYTSTKHGHTFRIIPKFSQVLDRLLFALNLKTDQRIKSYLLGRFIEENSDGTTKTAETFSQIDVLRFFAKHLTHEQKVEAIDKAAGAISIYEDVDWFLEMESDEALKEAFEEWMGNNSLSEITTELVAEDIQTLDYDTVFEFKEKLEDLTSRYEFDHQYADNLYDDTLKEYQRMPDYDEVHLDEDMSPGVVMLPKSLPSEEDDIKDMFESLRENA